MRKRRTARHGYAIMLTLFFIVLFLALLGVVWLRTASVLRIDTARTIQTQRDTGSIQALARALRLLEGGLPSASPYVCEVTPTSASGPHASTVTFTQTDQTQWTVHAAPKEAGRDAE